MPTFLYKIIVMQSTVDKNLLEVVPDKRAHERILGSTSKTIALIQGFPTFSDHVPFGISTDEHVPQKFLTTRNLSEITKIHRIFDCAIIFLEL